MVDFAIGARVKRGNWSPNALALPAPFWRQPYSPKRVIGNLAAFRVASAIRSPPLARFRSALAC